MRVESAKISYANLHYSIALAKSQMSQDSIGTRHLNQSAHPQLTKKAGNYLNNAPLRLNLGIRDLAMINDNGKAPGATAIGPADGV